MLSFAILLACAALAHGQAQGGVCTDNGFFRDPTQCDKYYDCYRGVETEKLCPDGLVFDDSLGGKVEQCNYPFIVSCPEGASLQPPQSSGIECPRMNGYFEHEDPANCHQYYECTNGVAGKRMCSENLVFDEFTGSCQWEHTRIRSGCGPRIVVLDDGFSCPNVSQVHSNGATLDHARYLKPDDCRYFYVCQDGKTPQLSGCPESTVFNDVTLSCDTPESVPGCENYYTPTSGGQA